MSTFVYLASASPRRQELLTQLGVRFEVLPAAVDEDPLPGEAAADLVCRLAVAKALAGVAVRPAPGVPVVAADTSVALGAELFAKPLDQADAARILGRLSGRTHTVFTAVAVADGQRERVELSRSEVTFRTLAPEEIAAYWRTGEPADKAGAYAIQGRGAQFIADLRGSYSGVMGLPLFETARLLTLFGCAPL
ncbi:MAG: septum formation inhibitor Maf [Chromatiales bacterium]|nr:septum formation inhibitor Maf [Chromatiales bacterium]